MKKNYNLLYCAIILSLFAVEMKAQTITDADGNTKVETERTANDDIIRFRTGGTDAFQIVKNRLETVNSGRSIFIGDLAGDVDDLSENAGVFIGSQAGRSNTAGNFNIGIGANSLNLNTVGNSNAAIGVNALRFNIDGNSNAAIGGDALRSNIGGNFNAAIGASTLFSNTTGSFNAAISRNALFSNIDGSNNAAIGVNALFSNIDGGSNAAIGVNALRSNTSGSNNISIGTSANRFNQTGSNNTIIGALAGSGTSVHNKSGNVFLGYQAGFSETGSNKLYIENSTDVSTPLIYGDFASNRVAIGTSEPAAGYALSVNGKVISEEVRVLLKSAPWPDYVFKPEYRLRTLEEVDGFIKTNGHLPNIPSAKEVEKEGIALGGMNKNLLEKIEELTLYMIEMNKDVKELKAENKSLKKEIESLKK